MQRTSIVIGVAALLVASASGCAEFERFEAWKMQTFFGEPPPQYYVQPGGQYYAAPGPQYYAQPAPAAAYGQPQPYAVGTAPAPAPLPVMMTAP